MIQITNGISGANNKLISFKESHTSKCHADSFDRITGDKVEDGVEIVGFGQGTREIIEGSKVRTACLFLLIKKLVLFVLVDKF